jgi:gamma-glutamyltranspeptidase/glutathione hydrolase
MFAPHRARIIGTRHMAAAGQYLAAQAAFQILEAGGNAIDAGVAGGIALGVVQSEYVCFAGVAPMMIYLAETDEVVTISGLGSWPKLTNLQHFHEKHGGRIPGGILQTVVPAAPDAWITALARYGTMSYGEVAEAALRFARDGFPAPSLMCDIIRHYEKDYRISEANAAIYLANGRPPETGELFVQTDLAGVIQHMIDEERAAATRGGRVAGLTAARDAFYKGDIAKMMVAFHEQNGGWLRADDLAEFASDVEPAYRAGFAGAEIYTCGPWCQGPLLGEALNILDGMDLRGLGHNSAPYIHTLVEALKLAYADRHALYGDPKFVDVPMRELLSSDYARKRRAEIDPHRAHPGMPRAGLPSNWAPELVESTADPKSPRHVDTSYVCAVDRFGNAFSSTPSDGSMGVPVIPGLGFAPSSRGSQSSADPRSPAVLGPGRRPRLTPSPSFARKPGKWIMPLGSPGNDVQPQAMLQVFLNMHVFGMPPQEAIEQPRFATFSYPRTSDPHSYSPGLLNVEGRLAVETRDELSALGHKVQLWPDWEYAAGGVCTILAETKPGGVMEGGSDPRRPTAVAGW